MQPTTPSSRAIARASLAVAVVALASTARAQADALPTDACTIAQGDAYALMVGGPSVTWGAHGVSLLTISRPGANVNVVRFEGVGGYLIATSACAAASSPGHFASVRSGSFFGTENQRCLWHPGEGHLIDLTIAAGGFSSGSPRTITISLGTANLAFCDRDGDGLHNPVDNCPDAVNGDQAQCLPHSGVGDACNADDDSDGLLDGDDPCPCGPHLCEDLPATACTIAGGTVFSLLRGQSADWIAHDEPIVRIIRPGPPAIVNEIGFAGLDGYQLAFSSCAAVTTATPFTTSWQSSFFGTQPLCFWRAGDGHLVDAVVTPGSFGGSTPRNIIIDLATANLAFCDRDGDGPFNPVDNCPDDPNADQARCLPSSMSGDACNEDDDGDGVPDVDDPCPCGATAQPDICNHVDDDCDGAVDNPVGPALGGAAGVNLLACGDYVSRWHSIGGPIAVLGDVVLTGVSLGVETPGAVVARVAGSLYLTDGQIHGDAIVNGLVDLTRAGFVDGGALVAGDAGVASLCDDAIAASVLLQSAVTNGAAHVTPWTIELVGASPELNVFELDGALIGARSSLVVRAPSGSRVIVDVGGPAVSFVNTSARVEGVTAADVVYNLYEAESVLITSAGIDGTVLAPFADVHFDNAEVRGALLGAGVWGWGSGTPKHRPFVHAGGCPPTPPPPPPPPATTCAVRYQVDVYNAWAFGANVTVTNEGGAVSGWSLAFTLESASITGLWNGVVTQSGSAVVVGDAGWNASIPAGGSVGFGFNASGAPGATPTFTLNGGPCRVE